MVTLKKKLKVLALSLIALVMGLSVSVLQSPQSAYSQTDYEEYIIMEDINQQSINQQNTGSGSSTNINCGTNTAGTNLRQTITCPSIPGETPSPGTTVTPVVTQREGNVVNLLITGVTSTATCNNDEVVVGGGYRATDNFNIRSEQKVGNSWQINVIGSEGPGVTFQALAECLKLVPG